MNYLIKTTYQNASYSHIVKGLDVQEIETLFHPESIVQANDETPTGDILATGSYTDKQFQIISSMHKIVDFFYWIYAFTNEQHNLTIESINSISQPIDEERAHELVKQLMIKATEQQNALTPKMRELVVSMNSDVKDFISRFTGYMDESDADILQWWSHDMQMYAEQWNVALVKETMGRIIEKMEILEWEYVKSINTNDTAPLQEFNHELNSIINQNRLFRSHNLNQLSGGSNADYVWYKLKSWLRLFFDSLGTEFHDVWSLLKLISYYISWLLQMVMIISLIILFGYYIVSKQETKFPFILFATMGLVSILVHGMSTKKTRLALPGIVVCIIGWYYLYEAIAINFWL